ncbi:XRE family transcriptional regulator [Rhodoligotrophos ferricapiens]|uniref:XRE family transcriptional regulator n=1 Tax=Rhodoligotrophos ferricapiens TaxID=3069264 RepID=UPI00315D231F
MANPLIGQRLRVLREEKKLSQDDLARLFGFKDRQTVSAIETGERRLSADELLLAVRELGAPLDYFTDPFRLVGEGRFNWRQSNVPPAVLGAYERVAGQLIAAFRTLGTEVGEKPPLERRSLRLTKNSRFEDAAEAGERFATEHKLGDVPARRLPEVMERDLNILVLMVTPSHHGVSGAACRLPDLDVVLINRDEVPGRRHFDLAHELFHILTWDAMPPVHVEDVTETGGANRVEQLANAFASALLMPARTVQAAPDWRKLRGDALVAQLNATADHLEVTSTALMWRLVSLDLLDKTEARAVPADAIRNNGHPTGLFADNRAAERPPLFSKRFVEIVARAIEEGRVSVRKIASLLGLSVDDLGDLFAAHGVPAPYEL